PDSPTNPSISPGSTEKDTSDTRVRGSGPRSVPMVSPLTRTAGSADPVSRMLCFLCRGVTEEVEAQDQRRQHGGGDEDNPRGGRPPGARDAQAAGGTG